MASWFRRISPNDPLILLTGVAWRNSALRAPRILPILDSRPGDNAAISDFSIWPTGVCLITRNPTPIVLIACDISESWQANAISMLLFAIQVVALLNLHFILILPTNISRAVPLRLLIFISLVFYLLVNCVLLWMVIVPVLQLVIALLGDNGLDFARSAVLKLGCFLITRAEMNTWRAIFYGVM